MSTVTVTAMQHNVPLTENIVKGWTENECREALKACMDLTAEAIRRAALIVKVMDEQDFDLSEMPQKYINALRKVAANQLLPQFMLECSTTVLNALSTLPKSVQEKLLKQKAVEVLTDSGETLRVPLPNLQASQVKQVIRDGVVQDAAGQRAYRESVKKENKQALETFFVDYNARAVVVRRSCEISLRQLKRWVRELSMKGE